MSVNYFLTSLCLQGHFDAATTIAFRLVAISHKLRQPLLLYYSLSDV